MHLPRQSFWGTLFLLLGVIDSHIVVQYNQQEQRHAKHVGKYSQLHVCHHSAKVDGTSGKKRRLGIWMMGVEMYLFVCLGHGYFVRSYPNSQVQCL